MINRKEIAKIVIDRINLLNKENDIFRKNLAKEIMVKGYGIEDDEDLYYSILIYMPDIIPYRYDYLDVYKTIDILPEFDEIDRG